jgi:acetylornithine deacetylase/succinyl-diaminopimelate desuccinylase-like protein
MKPAARLDATKLDARIDSIRGEFESRLGALVEIPTVSMEPHRDGDIVRGAELAAQYIRAAGGRADVVPTGGHPMVLGEIKTSNTARWVTIYNHLDVQPARLADGWEHEPFSFRKVDGRYEGRGTTDDKGPALTALYAARMAADEGVALNYRFIWEMEEEIGSPHFDSFVRSRKDALKTDSVLVSDTIWIARGKPAISYGLRGLQSATLSLETGTKDVHSGLTGGAARNPLTELAIMVCECYDLKTGKIKIPHFYDDVVKPTKAEIDSFLASGWSPTAFKSAHGLRRLRSADKRELVESIWARPTFEVHGMVGGYTGPGVKTAIAPRAEIKISMRLVPNQKPAKIYALFRNFVQGRNPDVQVTADAALAPYLGEFSGPFAEAAKRAMQFGFGKKPAFTREGGSIGAVVTMKDALKAPVVFMGLSLPEHGYHAPNENFDWEQAAGGMKSFVHYFDELSRL